MTMMRFDCSKLVICMTDKYPQLTKGKAYKIIIISGDGTLGIHCVSGKFDQWDFEEVEDEENDLSQLECRPNRFAGIGKTYPKKERKNE